MIPASRISLKRAKLPKSFHYATQHYISRNSGQRCNASAIAYQEPNLPGAHPGNTLRNTRWNVPPDTTYQATRTGTVLAKYNQAIHRAAYKGGLVECLAIATQMKMEKVLPDIHTYNNLLLAASLGDRHSEAWAIFEDLKLNCVTPDRTTFLHLIRAQRFVDSSYYWDLVDQQTALGIQPTVSFYSLILHRFLREGYLEFATQFLRDMRARGIIAELQPASGLVKLAARRGFPGLALDLLDSIESDSIRKLDHEVWMGCLISSAEALFGQGTTRCWNVVVRELNIAPDEGLCIAVLNTAARNGLPDLATDALRVLELVGCHWQGYHFAAVVEAFARASRVKEALTVISIMRSSNITPDPETCLPILHKIGGDIDSIDSTWNVIDELHKDGTKIDVAALNVIVQATVAIGDLQRAVGAYKSYPEYKVQPDVHTFNSLLEGCTNAAHRELGDRLLADMKEAKVRPDRDTYMNLVMLCLTQETYEDAFFYLEEMKAAKHRPPVFMYEAIVRRCLLAKDTRYEIALAEMKEIGYHPSIELLRDIDAALKPSASSAEQPELAGLDGSAQRFIETGGLHIS